MRAAIYARVSSQAQRDRHTIENQLRELPAYVASQGWTLVGTYVDDGRSAKTGKLDARDGFAQLLRDAEAKKFDALVVVAIDRLTRTDDMMERAAILGPFQRAGIDIVTPSGGRLDLRTMLGEMYTMMQALVAAEENRIKGERIKAGKLRAIAEGRKPSGPTPYGLDYNRATGRWLVHPVTGPIVAEMFERVLAGESTGTISNDFIDREVARPRGRWTRERVWAILRSRHVVGEWTVDKRRKLVIAVPPIVSEETWQRVQDALKKHGKRGLRKTKHVYLLEGIARCGACGGAIHIRSAMNGRKQASPAAYVCRHRKFDIRGSERCGAPIIPTATADARVWAKLSEMISNPELIDAAISQRVADVAAQDWKADAEGYRRRLGRLDRAESAILARFRRGAVSEGALDVELDAINRDRTAIRAQLATAEQAVAAATASQFRAHGAKETLARLRPILPNASQEARRELVEMLVVPGSVTFHGREIQFFAGIPVAVAKSHVGGGASVSLVRGPGWEPQHESNLRIRLVA